MLRGILLAILPSSTLAMDAFTGIEGSLTTFIAALFGAVVSSFIRTEVDVALKYPSIAKLVSGTSLGYFACISWHAYSPDLYYSKLTIVAFALGSLATPIMVFLLSWASARRTRVKAESRLNKLTGLEESKDE